MKLTGIEDSEFRVLVCGGRDYGNQERVNQVLDAALESANLAGRTFVLIHGAARGADRCSHVWASMRQINDVRVFKADWENHGRSAGPIRNKLMLKDGDPHVIVAFKGGRGTADMIRQGKKAGVPVYEVK